MSNSTAAASPADPADPGASADGNRADWFELFFDLVFVATVNVLAHSLHGDPGPADFGRFLVLFFPAWWAWVNLMVTANLFGPASRRVQVMLLATMPALGVMAAAAPEGLGSRAWAFALGAAWVRLVLFLPWWGPTRRAGTVVPRWRSLLYGLVPAVLWAASAGVPGAGRFVLWGVAIALEVVLLALQAGVGRAVYDQLAVEHLVERIGMFVVIVLGESVLTIVTALADHFTATGAAAALAGFATIAALAVMFYLWGTPESSRGLESAQTTGATSVVRDTVMYLPFALVAAITVIAAALGTAVSEPDHPLPTGAHWALLGGLLTHYTASAALSLRHGEALGTVLSWYLPCLLLTTGALLPAGLLLPAWAAVAVAAALLILITAVATRHGPPTG